MRAVVFVVVLLLGAAATGDAQTPSVWGAPRVVASRGMGDPYPMTAPIVLHNTNEIEVLWIARNLSAALYGTDADIFSSLSQDGGRTWSAPSAVNSQWATSDSADDGPLAAVVDSSGAFALAMWFSVGPSGDTVHLSWALRDVAASWAATAWNHAGLSGTTFGSDSGGARDSVSVSISALQAARNYLVTFSTAANVGGVTGTDEDIYFVRYTAGTWDPIWWKSMSQSDSTNERDVSISCDTRTDRCMLWLKCNFYIPQFSSFFDKSPNAGTTWQGSSGYYYLDSYGDVHQEQTQPLVTPTQNRWVVFKHRTFSSGDPRIDTWANNYASGMWNAHFFPRLPLSAPHFAAIAPDTGETMLLFTQDVGGQPKVQHSHSLTATHPNDDWSTSDTLAPVLRNSRTPTVLARGGGAWLAVWVTSQARGPDTIYCADSPPIWWSTSGGAAPLPTHTVTIPTHTGTHPTRTVTRRTHTATIPTHSATSPTHSATTLSRAPLPITSAVATATAAVARSLTLQTTRATGTADPTATMTRAAPPAVSEAVASASSTAAGTTWLVWLFIGVAACVACVMLAVSVVLVAVLLARRRRSSAGSRDLVRRASSLEVPMAEVPAYLDVRDDVAAGGSLGASLAAVGAAAAAGSQVKEYAQLPERAKLELLASSHLIALSELFVVEEVGKGEFGVVYRAEWRGAPVACKKLREGLSHSQESEIYAEAALHKSIPPHPNVVQFLGVASAATGEFCIVSEFCAAGALRTLLKQKAIADEQKLGVALGIARGMAHLHSANVVHRDLAARNILLCTDLTPKVADFGLSRVLATDSDYITKRRVLPMKWLAPESLEARAFSPKTDVWSFGVTMFELVVHSPPYKGRSPFEIVQGVSTGSLRPALPTPLPPSLAALGPICARCFSFHPEGRPSFVEIAMILEAS